MIANVPCGTSDTLDGYGIVLGRSLQQDYRHACGTAATAARSPAESAVFPALLLFLVSSLCSAFAGRDSDLRGDHPEGHSGIPVSRAVPSPRIASHTCTLSAIHDVSNMCTTGEGYAYSEW